MKTTNEFNSFNSTEKAFLLELRKAEKIDNRRLYYVSRESSLADMRMTFWREMARKYSLSKVDMNNIIWRESVRVLKLRASRVEARRGWNDMPIAVSGASKARWALREARYGLPQYLKIIVRGNAHYWRVSPFFLHRDYNKSICDWSLDVIKLYNKGICNILKRQKEDLEAHFWGHKLNCESAIR